MAEAKTAVGLVFANHVLFDEGGSLKLIKAQSPM
jgi:hypothetical protein